jgi:hypothetical protein
MIAKLVTSSLSSPKFIVPSAKRLNFRPIGRDAHSPWKHS